MMDHSAVTWLLLAEHYDWVLLRVHFWSTWWCLLKFCHIVALSVGRIRLFHYHLWLAIHSFSRYFPEITPSPVQRRQEGRRRRVIRWKLRKELLLFDQHLFSACCLSWTQLAKPNNRSWLSKNESQKLGTTKWKSRQQIKPLTNP